MYTPPCSRRSAGSSGRRWVFACTARPLLGCARARPSHFRRANKSARGGFDSRALHSRPGIRIYSMRMRARSEFASIAAEINPKPGPGWELPAAAQGAHPAIAGHPSSRCPAGMLLCGIGLHCMCTHMRMRIRMPGRARVRSPWAQARFCWRGGSAMALRACSPACCEKPRAGHAGAAAVAVGRCAQPHHRNKPTIHLNMIALSSLAYIRAIMNAFMFHTRRTTISWLSEQNY